MEDWFLTGRCTGLCAEVNCFSAHSGGLRELEHRR